MKLYLHLLLWTGTGGS